jgi:hypothetical protein
MNDHRSGAKSHPAPTPVRAAALIMLGCLWATASSGAVTPVHKCTENGVVTFQNMPCRPDEPGARPTPAQLNAAERQKKQQRQKAASDNAQQPAPKRSK